MLLIAGALPAPASWAGWDTGGTVEVGRVGVTAESGTCSRPAPVARRACGAGAAAGVTDVACGGAHSAFVPAAAEGGGGIVGGARGTGVLNSIFLSTAGGTRRLGLLVGISLAVSSPFSSLPDRAPNASQSMPTQNILSQSPGIGEFMPVCP